MNLTLDEFITLDIQTSGKHVYLLDDVVRLVQEWRALQAAAAEPDDMTSEVDRLLFGEREVEA